jgi:pimeloyl-ACP methyl ester carboxylesterase
MVSGRIDADMAPQQDLVEVRGARVRVLRAGSGDPLVYLHSLLGEVRWLPFFELLSRHFTVYVPENPGFGSSAGLERIDTVHDLAFHYADLLDEMGLERPHVAGLSLGGWIAAELAVHYPHRVRKLVLIDAMGLNVAGDFTPDIFAASPAETGSLLFKDNDSELAHSFVSDTPSPEMLDLMLASRQTLARVAWNPYLHDPKLQDRLYRVKAPTLILWGEADQFLSTKHGRLYEQRIEGAKLTIVKGSGHLPPLEKPEETARHICEFLKA